jgi:hypothetical protein
MGLRASAEVLTRPGYKAASHGVVPDVNVDYTIEELLAGTDKEMDVALKLTHQD